MAVIALASFSGAPGVTTTALALTFAWHRPALLVEADTAKTSSVLFGYLRGQLPHATGMTNLAIAQQNGALTADTIMEQRVPLTDQRDVILGFTNVAAGQGTNSLWGPLGAVLSTLDGAGTDVIVDLGRISARDPRIPLLQIADSVLLVMHPSLPDIFATSAAAGELREQLEAAGHRDYLDLLLVDAPFETWNRGEISKHLHAEVTAEIKHDPRGAATFSIGLEQPKKFLTGGYIRSIRAAQANINQRIQRRHQHLGARPSQQESAS